MLQRPHTHLHSSHTCEVHILWLLKCLQDNQASTARRVDEQDKGKEKINTGFMVHGPSIQQTTVCRMLCQLQSWAAWGWKECTKNGTGPVPVYHLLGGLLVQHWQLLSLEVFWQHCGGQIRGPQNHYAGGSFETSGTWCPKSKIRYVKPC